MNSPDPKQGSDPFLNPYLNQGGDELSAEETIRRGVRAGQLITFSLITGLLVISAVFLTIVPPGDQELADNAQATDPLVVAGFGVGVFLLILSRLVPQLRLRGIGRHPDIASKIAQVQAATIIGQALAEAAGVLNLVLMLVSHSLLCLTIVPLAVVGILLQIPTIDRWKRFIQGS